VEYREKAALLTGIKVKLSTIVDKRGYLAAFPPQKQAE
jgi:hypothetical protein